MEPQQAQVKLEVLEVLVRVKLEAEVKADRLSPPHGSPHAHGDAVSSLADLALPTPHAAEAAADAAPKRSGPVGPHTSDFLGVYWEKRGRKWNAAIRHNGKYHHLGYFDNEQEAAMAYDTAARRLRPTGEAHGVKIDSQGR